MPAAGEVTGTQSNWLSGNGGEGSSMRGAANDLRNKAAAMGGNVIYGANSPSQNLLSSFAPLDSKMVGRFTSARKALRPQPQRDKRGMPRHSSFRWGDPS